MDDPAEPSHEVHERARCPKPKRTIDGCGCLVAPVGFVLLVGGLLALGDWLWFRAKAEPAQARVVKSAYSGGQHALVAWILRRYGRVPDLPRCR